MIKTQHCPNCETQAAEIERLRVEAEARYDRGYYDGCTLPIVRHDALRKALRTARDYVEAVVEAATDTRSAHIKAMAAADLITIDAALQEQSK